MSQYVYIVKSNIKVEEGSADYYVLSCPLTLKEARLGAHDMSIKERSIKSIMNRIIELYIPVNVFEKFREDNSEKGFYSSSSIKAFIELNQKYQSQALKLLSSVSAKDESKDNETNSKNTMQVKVLLRECV